MELMDIELITPERHEPGQRPLTEKVKARIRLVIESVFYDLKHKMRLDRRVLWPPMTDGERASSL